MKKKKEQDFIFVTCKAVKFFSPCDEDAFFYWIKKIKSIKECKGVKDSIILSVLSNIPDKDLRNLIGLCRRYKISLTKLKPLMNEHNAEYFGYCKEAISINVYPAH